MSLEAQPKSLINDNREDAKARKMTFRNGVDLMLGNSEEMDESQDPFHM